MNALNHHRIPKVSPINEIIASWKYMSNKPAFSRLLGVLLHLDCIFARCCHKLNLFHKSSVYHRSVGCGFLSIASHSTQNVTITKPGRADVLAFDHYANRQTLPSTLKETMVI